MTAIARSSKRFAALAKALDESAITKGIKSVDPFLLEVGNRVQLYLQGLDSQRKYLAEVILRVPLIFILHQWFLLSPTSSYRIIETALFAFRLLGGTLLFGMWAMPPKTLIPIYIATGTDILFGWILQYSYWMYQNEAEGTCDIWWGEGGAPWWTVSTTTIGFQLLYAIYLNQKYDSCANLQMFEACVITASIVPHLFCMTAVFIGVSAAVFYWLTKVIFIAVGFGQIVYYYTHSGLPLRKLSQDELKQLTPGKWFMRDLLVLFTLVYFCLCVLIDCLRTDSVGVLTVPYLTSFMGDWCTTLVIIVGLSASFGYLSNLLVALSRYLITGEKAFAAAVFDINIGGRVNLIMTLFCLEAGLLTVDSDMRIQNFKSVIFLTFYVILAQVWDMTEQQCHIVTNSGEKRTVFAYLRVLMFAATITLLPTLVTFKAASYLQVDVWLLLNASGTILILCRAFCSLLELILGTLAWHTDNHLDKLEDTIYLIRLFKNLTTGVTSLLLAYYRLCAPFFNSWIFFRLALVVFEVIGVAKFIVYKEWIGFQNRRKFLKRLNTVPDATEDQLRELNDVCSICFIEMSEGKVLQCSHIFHKACLRKWFQLRTTCPLCNVAAF